MQRVLAALLVVGCAAPAAAAEQRFARTVSLPANSLIQIDATIADVLVEGSTRADVLVQVVRRAPTDADLAQYPLVVDAAADGVHVSAVQADGGVNPAFKTEIHISAPATAVIAGLKVFEGHVRLVNLRGGCEVSLRRGAIEAVGVGGRVRLESELGSIDVRNAELTEGGMIHLRVFNGDAKISFARRPADARILAVAYNGTISSAIPLTLKDKFGPRFGETLLGRGAPVLSIDVVKGNIAIKVG